jgi:uncharacterized protein
MKQFNLFKKIFAKNNKTKILLFTDIHGSNPMIKKLHEKIKKHDPDFLVCCGDVSFFEDNIFSILKKLNNLNKKIIIIHGNHEDESTFKKYSKIFKNLIHIHKRCHIEKDIIFLGYGGGGFAMNDLEFEKLENKFEKILKKHEDKKAVMVTHGPPYRTKLDYLGNHVGNKSLRKFVEKNKIHFLFCGHLHENFEKEDKINKTRVINPGPNGKIIDI